MLLTVIHHREQHSALWRYSESLDGGNSTERLENKNFMVSGFHKDNTSIMKTWEKILLKNSISQYGQ